MRWKATRASAVFLALIAWATPAFAEVQNVKVGGEVNVRSFVRKNLRLSEDVFNGVGGASTTVVDTTGGATSDLGSSGDTFLQQLTAVDIGADLTENVGTQLRLINQRVWGTLAADATNTATNDNNHLDISLANVSIKELFYSPLTVTVGRQRLWFGRGFIVGSRLVNGDVDPEQNLAADEFSDLTGFDAIRGTLDLSGVTGGLPLTIDGVYSKIDENLISGTNNATSSADDINLAGVNIGTRFSSMNGEAEAYFWSKRDNSNNNGATSKANSQANTLGIRGSLAPTQGVSLWSELAYQWGHRITSAIAFDAEGAAGDAYQAWAANLGLDYTASQVAWTPTVGGEWIFFSGDDSGGTAIAGWDPVFRGNFTSALREFQGAGFYMPAQSGATVGGTYNNVTGSTTNQHQLALHATVKPLEDLSIDNRLTWFVADIGIRPVANSKRENYFGNEWDMQAKYNYTDDVQLGLTYALFNPGNVFRTPYDDTAQELITSVDVKF